MKLNSKQQLRLDIVSQYLSGQIFREDARLALNISSRQFSRIVKGFREDGLKSLVHGNRGREPCNKTKSTTLTKIFNLYKGRYSGLNLVHFIEKLNEYHLDELKKIPCYSTIRNRLIEKNLLKVERVKRLSSKRMRKRYEKEGLMIQIDGSHHHWLVGHGPICLTAAIDDASGKIVGAKFTKTETTFAAMDVVEQILKTYGRFQMLYSDKAGIYGGGKREGYSNMTRALRELDIVSVQANTPQAKGRIERLFKTLQSRLVQDMRLDRIRTIEEANTYLKGYIKLFNAQFSREVKDNKSAYRELGQADLYNIFTRRIERQVQSGYVVNCEGVKYLVREQGGSCLVKKRLEIRHYRDGKMRMFLLNGEEVDYVLWENVSKAA